METFTSGKVSAAARRAVLQDVPQVIGPDAFSKCRGGYIMRAWASQIAYARARGRGIASAKGRPIHKFDAKQPSQWGWKN